MVLCCFDNSFDVDAAAPPPLNERVKYSGSLIREDIAFLFFVGSHYNREIIQ